jgi:hypothetical protein
LLEKIEDLNDEISSLKTKEQKLMQEIKKRGDLARQLCSAKDEEIKQLREKLHFDQRQQQQQLATSPVQRRKSGPPMEQEGAPEHCNGHPKTPAQKETSDAKGNDNDTGPSDQASLLSVNTHPSQRSNGSSSASDSSVLSIDLTEEDVIPPYTPSLASSH